jgi:4-amino-4-deoxy-L-arabinose transferase-like glycosyltransferase
MQRLERNLLVLILLISALLSILTLTRGHLWWDDFASYIMQAQSLLKGSPADFVQHNRFTIENSSYAPGPIAYPWGFPAILAPLLAIFGMKIVGLKLVNTFFYLLFLLVFYFLARSRLPWGSALLVVAILAFNPAMLAAHDLILSDIPFLFFSTLAILLIESQAGISSPRLAVLTGLLIFIAFSLRTNGLLLLVPLFVSQVLSFKSPAPASGKRWYFLPYIVFLALFLLLKLALPGGQESYFTHFSLFSPSRLLHNLLYYVALPSDLVRAIPLGLLFLWLAVLFFAVDLFVNFRRNRVFLSYMAASLALFIVWPETQGLRFLFPLLPLFLLISAEGLLFVKERLRGKAAQVFPWAAFALVALFLLLSLGVSTRKAWANLKQGREINGPFDPVSRQMFEFIRDDTPSGSVIIFFKPRLMRLLTGRDSFMTQRCDDLARGDYIVLHEKQGSNGQIGDLSVCPSATYPIVFNNQRFTVYQVTP